MSLIRLIHIPDVRFMNTLKSSDYSFKNILQSMLDSSMKDMKSEKVLIVVSGSLSSAGKPHQYELLSSTVNGARDKVRVLGSKLDTKKELEVSTIGDRSGFFREEFFGKVLVYGIQKCADESEEETLRRLNEQIEVDSTANPDCEVYIFASSSVCPIKKDEHGLWKYSNPEWKDLFTKYKNVIKHVLTSTDEELGESSSVYMNKICVHLQRSVSLRVDRNDFSFLMLTVGEESTQLKEMHITPDLLMHLKDEPKSTYRETLKELEKKYLLQLEAAKSEHEDKIFLNPVEYSSPYVVKKRVMQIGIDGCRPDALFKASTPNIDRLAEEGAFSLKSSTTDISMSATGWSTMLTGVLPHRHSVLENDFTHREQLKNYKHVFSHLKKNDPSLKTASICTWTPINEVLLHDTNYCDFICDTNEDGLTAQKTADLLTQEEDLGAVFVHIDCVDVAGHANEFSPNCGAYISAIEEADGYVGQISAALQKRIKEQKSKNVIEDWLIVLCTDHGGLGDSHGNNIPECMTVFMYACGGSSQRGIMKPTHVADISPTILTHMQVPKEQWKYMNGKPFGLPVLEEEE